MRKVTIKNLNRSRLILEGPIPDESDGLRIEIWDDGFSPSAPGIFLSAKQVRRVRNAMTEWLKREA